MKILETLTIDDTTYLFIENPEEHIKKIKEDYLDDERSNYMGYKLPEIVDFKFMGNTYKAITFWHDNEDPRDIKLEQMIK